MKHVCNSCGSLDVVPIPAGDDPIWLIMLRDVTGWPERGAIYEDNLGNRGWSNQFDQEELEEAVESFASVQEKTLKGYTNLVAAFKTHIRKGYHSPQSDRTAAPQRKTSRASDGRY